MADWISHLYCANIVAGEIGITGIDLDKFLYGNLLPDVNAGWLIEPEVRLDQAGTHFYDVCGPDYYWAPYRFFAKYEKKIREKNPVYLGYQFHLWLDLSIMTEFMSRVPVSMVINNGEAVREWKWKELWAFIRNHPQSLSADNITEIAEEAKGIEEITVFDTDLAKIPSFLVSLLEKDDDCGYHFFDEEAIEKAFLKICGDFVSWYKGL